MMGKNVSFGDILIAEFNEEKVPQKAVLWYNHDEIKEIQKDTKVVLETQQSLKRRLMYVQSVLALQDEHRDQDLKDEKGLQSYACALSKSCAKEARKRASVDSQDALQAHMEELSNSSFSSVTSFLSSMSAEEFAKPTPTFRKSRETNRSSTYRPTQ